MGMPSNIGYGRVVGRLIRAMLDGPDVKVTHKGRIWTSTAANNTWEPGSYGWTDIGPA